MTHKRYLCSQSNFPIRRPKTLCVIMLQICTKAFNYLLYVHCLGSCHIGTKHLIMNELSLQPTIHVSVMVLYYSPIFTLQKDWW